MTLFLPANWVRIPLVALLLYTSVVIAEEQEKSKDEAEPKQVHYPVSAPELIAKLKRDEEALYKIRSLYIRAKAKTVLTETAVEAARKALEAQFPGQEITPDKFPEVRPTREQEFEKAFDEHRIRQHHRRFEKEFETFVWDGKIALAHEGRPKDDGTVFEYHAISNDPKRFVIPYFLSDTPWKFLSEDKFWWSLTYSENELRHYRELDPPEEYVIADKRDYHGIDCYVLENHLKRIRLFVTANDHRLRGFVQLFLPTNYDQLAALSRVAGIDFKNAEEMKTWYGKRTEEEKEKSRTSARSIDIMFEYARPLYELFLDDYREILPGLWCPFQQTKLWYVEDYGHKHFDSPISTRDYEVVEIKVNQPLPDELFTLAMVDGARVNDFRYGENILTYTYKKDRSPAEWEAIVEKHRKANEQSEKQKAFRDSLIGKPAFEFPKATWLGSPPLDWKSLKGKVVVLFFWAHWCGPCHRDLPLLAGYQEGRKDPGVVLIGVHTPGSEIADIEKDMKANHVSYPIMIDIPRPDSPPSWGLMMHQYGVNMLPYAVVIDQDGKIARHGDVSRIIDDAYDMPHEKQKK